MIISKTPLRLSIVGGGTDLPLFYEKEKGQVISFSINKYIYVIVKERYDKLIVLNYTQHEIVENVDEIKHDLIRECCKMVGIKDSIEISTLADIPSQGSGLGSSSAVTVGLLNALYQYKGITLPQESLAKKACKIEIEILKNPIGKQDQYIAAYGGVKKFVFNKDNSVDIYPFHLSPDQMLRLGSNLILHFTNQTRSASKILSQQNKNIPSNLTVLKEISSLVDELTRPLEEGKFEVIGDLLKKNWKLKRGLSKGITSDEINNMIKIAMSNGARGCKISGAGGGGFLMAYVERDMQNTYRNAMIDYRELPFMVAPFGSSIIFNLM